MSKNTLQNFSFDNNNIRYTEIDGINYASAVDCCRALGYKSPRADWANLKRRNHELLDYLTACKLQAFDGNMRDTDCLNNQGAIILSMLSKTDIGRRFRKIASKFLIEQMDRVQVPTDPAKQALMLAEQLIASNKEVLKLETKITHDKPMVDLCNDFISTEHEITVSDFGKLIGIGEIKLFKKLRDMKILGKSGRKYNLPMDNYIGCGWMAVTETPWQEGVKKGIHLKPMITPRGQIWLREKLINHQPDLFEGVK